MWFLFAMITALAWGGADLFYKKGTDSQDKYSHIKIVVIVGLVMGIHATVYLLVKKVDLHFMDLIKYLPVSAFYILSMTIGYLGLRYLDLSVASPVQNASGAVVAILCFIFFDHTLSIYEIIGITAITLGVIGLGIFENRDNVKVSINLGEDKKYRISFVAIVIPLVYCLLDGIGTFADAIFLDEMKLMSEDVALVAYEYTFLICAVICRIYLAVKKVPFKIYKEHDKCFAAVLETAGQFFYVFAMATNAIIVAPLIASYSIFSVLFSRIFLKERLQKNQYAVIALVMIGIVLLGVAESLA